VVKHLLHMALGAAVSAGMLTVPASVNSAHGAETVAVALSTTLSGSIAELGRTGLRGIQMALDRINAEGGLLGKQIRLVSADDGAFPANGVSNVRHMILVDKAVAIFGPATSAVGTAVETVAGQYRLPVFFHMANDIQITTSNFTKYAFELVPNTVMEPRAIAYYFAENVAPKTGGKKLKIATITPNYSYGRDTVEVFLKTLRELRVNFEVVAQELPQLGATDYTSYISALLAAHPDYVFAAIFGGDLITFTKQAQGFNFFKQTRIVGFYDQVALRVLGADSPEGAIGWNRAPFWAENGPGFSEFLADYRAKFHDAPSPWAITGYSAVQVWAYGVRKAGSFDADKVVAALSGATVPTIRGEITLRACDHQAEVPEFIGPVSAKIDPQYGQPIYSHTVIVAADKTMLTCTQAKSRQP
jgi:branched-chain amino acid transport system substrate-binding protein